MNIMSLDIRIGSTGLRKIDSRQEHFHKKVARMLLPSAGPVDRYGLEDSLLVDHNQYLYNPRVVKDLVQNAIADNVGMEHPLNLCIVDLT